MRKENNTHVYCYRNMYTVIITITLLQTGLTATVLKWVNNIRYTKPPPTFMDGTLLVSNSALIEKSFFFSIYLYQFTRCWKLAFLPDGGSARFSKLPSFNFQGFVIFKKSLEFNASSNLKENNILFLSDILSFVVSILIFWEAVIHFDNESVINEEGVICFSFAFFSCISIISKIVWYVL